MTATRTVEIIIPITQRCYEDQWEESQNQAMEKAFSKRSWSPWQFHQPHTPARMGGLRRHREHLEGRTQKWCSDMADR